MSELTRRQLFAGAGKVAAGGLLAFSVPSILYRSPWLERAAAQTAPTVRQAFIALVEAVDDVADEPTADWIIREFDKALPPLPKGSPSGAVAAVLDAYTARGGHHVAFAQASPAQRREVLRAMVLDPSPDIRQIANQVLPFASFAYYSDATLDEPARPGGPRPPQWDPTGFPGPSHSYLDTYEDDAPSGFQASGDAGGDR